MVLEVDLRNDSLTGHQFVPPVGCEYGLPKRIFKRRKGLVKAVISVTKNDIREGIPGDADSCPIARALHRAGFKYAYAVSKGIGANKGGSLLVTISDVAPLPNTANKFIENFDNDGKSVKPFKFTLNISNEKAKLLGYKAPAKKAA